MHDPGGDPLDRFLGRPLEISQFLRIAIGIASGLGSLHGRGIIHRNVKPPHLLVNVSEIGLFPMRARSSTSAYSDAFRVVSSFATKAGSERKPLLTKSSGYVVLAK
jgi:serine/threonine protein kinase